MSKTVGIKITGFLMAWMFVISMLSNCYCAPTTPRPSSSDQVVSHCKHHSNSPEKNKDCAPRYQMDQFENLVSGHVVEAPVISVSSVLRKENLAYADLGSFSKWASTSPPFSPPEFFVLHHSFLI